MLDDTSRAYLAAITRGDQAETNRLGAVLDTADTLDRSRPGQTLHAAALDYTTAGVPVFPIQPRGKKPLTEHGFKDATLDAARVTEWWTRWPDANIGVPTGHTFDVVDIDGTAGIASMYNGDAPAVDTLTVLGVALTSRDGGRHIYVPPTALGNKTNVWPSVDYRSVGGYVVVPPSVGANGRRYTWISPLAPTQAAAA